MLAKSLLSMSYNAVGFELNVNASTHTLNKMTLDTHTKQCVY
jgi:hypothetical protein